MLEQFRLGWAERSRRRAVVTAAGLILGLISVPAAATPDTHASLSDRPASTDLSAAVASYVNARSNAVSVAAAHAAASMSAAAAIPAFARKYGLRCSACHTAWPELNAFGQKFKDNGYQLGNDRDSPIWTNPAYWPVAVRAVVGWNYETTNNQVTDASDSATVTQSGFDISGADLLMLGTLYKNITFGFVPTLEDGELGIETSFVRFDNLFGSTGWNLKVGKFELDNMLSEKRIVTLSNNGSFYQSYHFVPVGDATTFGLGDNQIGMEVMGHSANSYNRWSLAILDGTDGAPGNGAGQHYDAMFTANHAWDAGKSGVERIGVYGYFGQRPTVFPTADGEPIAGGATTNKPFYRLGVVGDFFFGKWEFLPFYLWGYDSEYLATGTPGDAPLPPGAQASKWNGALLETHYYINPQFLLTQRTEFIRMSQQGLDTTPSTLGNVDAFTFGSRWYPIMISRAGLAVIGELSFTKTIGTAPLSGDGTGGPPFTDSTAVWSTSVLLGLDFDF